jgi:CheY-like chemotaxis protein
MRRAAALTHRLLAFSRRQTLSPKAIDVNRLMGELVELVRRTVGPGIEVEVVAAVGLWATMVDANQLENAILNLCINARDAMPGGGRITIESANRWLDRRAADERGMEPGQYVAVSVSDTGTGIDKDTLARVFDPFFTTKPLGEGTGLGLSMVYGFARQSHGHVRIYSEVGEGTMVSIYLPRHLGEAETDDIDVVDTAPAATGGQTVLVVDDEPTVRMLVTDALGDLGYRCVEAADGPAALKLLEVVGPIDLLITDVGLPGGLNGRQVADAVRAGRPAVKVLFITGYAENAALNHGHIERGMEVLTKPFAVDELSVRVERLLRA